MTNTIPAEGPPTGRSADEGAARSANLAAKFVLEPAAVAAVASWGSTIGSGVETVAIAIGAPLTVAALWGLLAAPRANRRLPLRALLTVFGQWEA